MLKLTKRREHYIEQQRCCLHLTSGWLKQWLDLDFYFRCHIRSLKLLNASEQQDRPQMRSCSLLKSGIVMAGTIVCLSTLSLAKPCNDAGELQDVFKTATRGISSVHTPTCVLLCSLAGPQQLPRTMMQKVQQQHLALLNVIGTNPAPRASHVASEPPVKASHPQQSSGNTSRQTGTGAHACSALLT